MSLEVVRLFAEEVRSLVRKRPVRYSIRTAIVAASVLFVVASINSYVHPAAALVQYRYIPDEHTYYCTYWAARTTKVGQPAPASCGAALVSAGLPPMTSVPYQGNAYAFGNCTYWVAQRRAEVGLPIPNTWGNATSWASRAAAYGFVIDHTPAPSAIMQISGGLGHVAFVESVDPDGTWHISEMNAIGFNRVDYRSLPAAAAARYRFIH